MLTEKENKTLIRLESDVAMPRWQYILIYGLTFGILMAIFNALTDVLIDKVPLAEIFRKKIWVNLAKAPIGGLLFGIILRWFSVKHYLKLKRKELDI
jgi:hypothetical protein